MRTLVIICAGALIVALVGPAAADGVADAKALIEKHSKLPTFVAAAPAFDAKACMADKKIFVIPLTNENPFTVAISKGMEHAAGLVGFIRPLGDPTFAGPVDAGHQQGGSGRL